MDTARLSSKGQITIPIDIRRKLGLRGGDKVVFAEQGESGIVVILNPNQIKWQDADTTFKYLDEYRKKENEQVITGADKNERRKILRSLYGTVNDMSIAEPIEVAYQSRRDWELFDQ